MKIIKIIFLSLLAFCLIACTGIFILFQTFDTDQYLPKMIQKASIALGRPVSIGNMGLGLSRRGITLDAGPMTVADDPNFTSQPFIKIDRVRISLDLGALILRREVHIKNILLQSPQIHFIRDQDGNINARSIGQKSHPAAIGTTTITATSKAKPRLENRELSLIIQDASVSFIDQSQNMPLDIWLRNINASLNDLSLSGPSQILFDASPLVLKGIAPGEPDNPVFKNIAGDLQSAGTLAATGNIYITGGVIKNLNIMKMALSHTLGIFGNMDAMIDKLGTNDTIIDKVQAKFSYHDKTIFIDDSLVKTNIFELTAKGSVDQGLSLDMQTMLRLNEDVSAALSNEFEGLKFFMDDSKRISIGASLKGVVPHLKYKPDKDFRKKSKKALIEEGGNILGVLLDGIK